jgi:scyllo-inositol 2-dehydrogenase (NADP+)
LTTQIQVGLIGYGMAGEVFHAPLIAAAPELCLRSVVERRSERASLRYPDALIVRSPEALLADPQIDLVVVATPNTSHFPLAQQALLAGKHVVVDKPFTITSGEAQEKWDADFHGCGG